ncbi:hypothetical protein DPQ33_02960 [Oceanidesulfovibrio indonesiensis]|uniref:Uncharacterized protein n=1 Tax=Oceanidesulfovibrio indonesiensis TaxID=54767 RepID=A0A7M3MIW6_9BACT|nr:hypothetical protein [Oceanidesulfovibrio indonesiensis]TVM19335.1 hypothetical protein DPQ33_02960 [Oceanidesulfovibrio indonesiensis]
MSDEKTKKQAILVAPVRLEPILAYPCPQCGAEVTVRARPKAVTLVCEKCDTFFGAHPLPAAALKSIQHRFDKAAAEIPKPSMVPENAYVFRIARPRSELSFSLAIDLQVLLKAFTNNYEATIQRLGDKRILTTGQIYDMSRLEGFASASITNPNSSARAFLEISTDGGALDTLHDYTLVAFEGVCAGFMGPHNPDTLVFSDCVIIGVDGYESEAGQIFDEIVYELPITAKRNRSNRNLVFTKPRQRPAFSD